MADYTLVAKLTANAEQFVAGFKKAEGTVANLQGKVSAYGKRFQDLGKKISSIGDSLTRKITLPAVAATSALVGVTLVKGFQRLVGIDTARAKLVGLGHDAESVELIMNSALDSVKGTAFGMDEAATTAANAVAAGIKPGKELTRYLTLTGDAAAIAGTEMSEMGSIINKVQTANKAYNGELQQLSDRGLPIYQWLAKEANTTADAIFDMASNGEISSEMLLNAIENNIGGAAKAMGEESFMAGIANIGAAIGRLGANFLDAGGQAGGFFSTVKPLLSSTIDFIDGLAGKAEDLGVRFGNAFMAMIDKFGQLKSWFDNLSPGIQSLILKGAAIGTAFIVGIGPALKIVGGLISAFGIASTVISALMGPVGLAVAGIAGLIAIGVALYNNWETVKEVAKDVFSSFSPLLETVKGAFKDLVDSVGPIWESLKNLFESAMPILQAIGVVVGGVLVAAFGLAISIFTATMSALGPIINAFINLADMLINVVLAAVHLLFGEWDAAIEYWNMATESAIEVFKSLWEGIVNFFSTFVETIIDFFYGLYMTLVGNSIIPDMVEAIVEWFQNMFQWLIDIVMNIVDGIVEAFTTIYETVTSYFEMVGEIIESVWTYIKGTFENALAFLVALVTGDFEGMKNAIQSQMQNAQNLLKNIWNAIDKFLSSTLGGIWDTVKNIFGNIFSTISNILGNVRSTVSNIWNGIRNTISSVLNGIRSVVSSVWNGIRSTISSVVNSIRSTISNIFNSLRGIVSNAFNAVRNAVSNGMRAALNVVTNMAKNFFNAGKNIVTSIADGIRGAIGNVTGAIGTVASKIRNFLPFSPAKEGPLMDIHRLNFDGPIGDSIDHAIPMIQRKMNLMLELPERVDPHGASLDYARNSGRQQANQTIQHVNDKEDISGLEGWLKKIYEKNQDIYMEGEKVGAIVRPHVNDGNAIDAMIGRYFD